MSGIMTLGQVLNHDYPHGFFYPAGFRSAGPVRKFITREVRRRRMAERLLALPRTPRTARTCERNQLGARLAYNVTFPLRHVDPLIRADRAGEALKLRRVGMAAAYKLAGLHRVCQRRGRA